MSGFHIVLKKKLTITNAKGVILHFFMRFVDLINLASEKCKIKC